MTNLIQSLRDAAKNGPDDVTPDMLTDAAAELERLGSKLDLAQTFAAEMIQQRNDALSRLNHCVALIGSNLSAIERSTKIPDWLANMILQRPVVERHKSNSLSAGGSANTDPVAGRVIAERSTSDPSAGVDGAVRESPQPARETMEYIDRLETLLGAAYQLAGLVNAPERFLDAFSVTLGYKGDPGKLLPVTLNEIGEYETLYTLVRQALNYFPPYDFVEPEVWSDWRRNALKQTQRPRSSTGESK